MKMTAVVALLLFAACNTSRPDAALRILALGDSYTIGEGVGEAERWPNQLARMLEERGIQVSDPEIIAKTGWTTDELSAAIDAANPRGPYDLVTLLIGVNNQYRGRSADEYRTQFKGLLERAIAFADGKPDRVIVVSIPDWGVTPFAASRDSAKIAREIDQFNYINRDESRRAGARWVDVTVISRRELEMVTSDGLHPSGDMYSLWAEAAMAEVVGALK